MKAKKVLVMIKGKDENLTTYRDVSIEIELDGVTIVGDRFVTVLPAEAVKHLEVTP
ncbi:hypothetical protein SEA_ANGLERFISH_80 [Mycobacterium phage Anglerfish]|uniref:hypothetical protein n=1 Tax=Mycobacterium phage Papez TaxID=1873891 RepID=UPI00080F3469|nr:hypothetical protein PBI_PAPEZ_80 [Mycobacterium phage Papez]ANT42047.1 hypothetical protein PBI_PAPEZ_80 [Mycobacterium phage Papez]QEA11539.1 hypothetical protein SEA_ANGLERFISH_80 [Mycobacterium phage Anglerfish]